MGSSRELSPSTGVKLEEARKCRECIVTGGFVEPCWALRESAQFSGKGLRHHAYVNLETLERSTDVYSVASGGHSKKGLALNFCPWCGTELRRAWKKSAEAGADQ